MLVQVFPVLLCTDSNCSDNNPNTQSSFFYRLLTGCTSYQTCLIFIRIVKKKKKTAEMSLNFMQNHFAEMDKFSGNRVSFLALTRTGDNGNDSSQSSCLVCEIRALGNDLFHTPSGRLHSLLRHSAFPFIMLKAEGSLSEVCQDVKCYTMGQAASDLALEGFLNCQFLWLASY